MRKTICIPEEDVSLEEAEQEHVLHVGVLYSQGADDIRKVRFVGRLLAEADVYHGQLSDRKDRGTHYRVYQTKAGKILVWWNNWTRWDGENDLLDYAVMDTLPGYDDEVYGKVHGFPEVLPGELLQEAAEALGEQLLEFVD